MPKKFLRDDTDIGHLAEELAGRWQQGDGVEPWLRDLEPVLSAKVRNERWSWESVARALNIAGILYRTGRPWTGTSLGKKVASIRYEARQVGAQDSIDLAGPVPLPAPALPAVAAIQLVQPVQPPDLEADAAAGDEPEFRPAALKGWSGTKIVRQEEKPPETRTSPAKPLTGDASDVIARLLGKK